MNYHIDVSRPLTVTHSSEMSLSVRAFHWSSSALQIKVIHVNVWTMNDHALLLNKDKFSEFSVSLICSWFSDLSCGWDILRSKKKNQAINYKLEKSYYKIKDPLADSSM